MRMYIVGKFIINTLKEVGLLLVPGSLVFAQPAALVEHTYPK